MFNPTETQIIENMLLTPHLYRESTWTHVVLVIDVVDCFGVFHADVLAIIDHKEYSFESTDAKAVRELLADFEAAQDGETVRFEEKQAGLYLLIDHRAAVLAEVA